MGLSVLLPGFVVYMCLVSVSHTAPRGGKVLLLLSAVVQSLFLQLVPTFLLASPYARMAGTALKLITARWGSNSRGPFLRLIEV